MTTQIETMFAQQLEERKIRLQRALSESEDPVRLRELLHDVDRALEKVSKGTYGLCEACLGPIESDRLALDPLVRYCVDHLSETEQHALERDIELARQIQIGLLPKKEMTLPGWTGAYHYEASGQVSGDYCDLIISAERPDSFFFIIGDVTGKGIAASMLMSQLHAMFRALAGTGLKLDELMERANRLFCEASLTTHFATLACGLATSDGEIKISNAGHCLPMVLRGNRTDRLPSSGIPLGVACDSKYGTERTSLETGESLLLFTDGFTESVNNSGEMYGEERISRLIEGQSGALPSELISTCIADLNSYSGSTRRSDDLTIMAIRKE